MRARPLAALLLAALALAAVACGDDDSGSGTGQTVNLTVSVNDGEGKQAKGTLKCDEGSAEGSGFLEDSADEHCRAARSLEKLLTTQPPRDRICTQVYGGPQTARITGTFGAQDVARSLARTDGCQIEDWKQADALLAASGIKAGAAGP
jgi:hypothetical protein